MRHRLTVLFVAAIAFLSVEIKTRAALVFIDRFEYEVTRTSPNAVDLFRQQGWATAKTQQSATGAHGYLYTVTSIPGYSGPFPGNNSTRVLAIEALPSVLGGQTDFYLQFGTGQVQNAIPGDVWFQFWLYSNDFGSQRSVYGVGAKFFYVCKDFYPCHSHLWMVTNGSMNFHSSNPLPYGEVAAGNFFWATGSSSGASYINYAGPGADEYSSDAMGQNRSSTGVMRNQWTLVKMHFNTTRTSGNSWEMWMRPYGGAWTKAAEWIGGVTPGFTWNIPSGSVGGHSSLRMPTTVGRVTNQNYNYWIYMDDFTIATTETDLPVYTDGGSSSRPASPTNLRIIGSALNFLGLQSPGRLAPRSTPAPAL